LVLDLIGNILGGLAFRGELRRKTEINQGRDEFGSPAFAEASARISLGKLASSPTETNVAGGRVEPPTKSL